jgi:endonuclease/exonuclease/phosphatase family metal-dependent hydrolase
MWLGHYKSRDNVALSRLLEEYDIIVIQELVARPYSVTFPDDTTVNSDLEAQAFFDEMEERGFSYWLSEEDTGPGTMNHSNTTATEWWVAFYKPERLQCAPELPWGFLAQDRSANAEFQRVPYAFAFRALDGNADFVLVSVHLDPASRDRRSEELGAIGDWIARNNSVERDFIILGDMNISSRDELLAAMLPGFVSLNDRCEATNTAPTGKPYDHVLYQPEYSPEVQADLLIVDLVAEMRAGWTSSLPYPGDPYNHDAFKMLYSDHRPIVFSLSTSEIDDD